MIPADLTQRRREQPTILLAEDEPIVRLALAETLRERGARVIECANADEALEVVLTDTPVDVLVTDVRMPGTLDGIALARRVKHARPGLPILVISADAPADAAPSADAFLRKPVVEETVCTVVDRLVAASRSAR
jgi:CheY-like chemotaxis protein